MYRETLVLRWLRRAGLAMLPFGALVMASGCTHVAPHQRERLAHPTMLLSDPAGAGEAHLYAIQEGAVGGASAVEGGCGCN